MPSGRWHSVGEAGKSGDFMGAGDGEPTVFRAILAGSGSTAASPYGTGAPSPCPAAAADASAVRVRPRPWDRPLPSPDVSLGFASTPRCRRSSLCFHPWADESGMSGSHHGDMSAATFHPAHAGPPRGSSAATGAPHPHRLADTLRAVKVYAEALFRVVLLGEYAEEAGVRRR